MLLDARPEPITIDPERAALLVIDMQNDFGTKGGMFDRAGFDISQIQEAAAPTARVIAAARRAGMKVIYLKMGFRPDLSDAGPKDSPNWIKTPSHAPRGGVPSSGRTTKSNLNP